MNSIGRGAVSVFVLLLGVFCSAPVLPFDGEEGAFRQEETMLMFVGEDLEVLSIASRREESAWQAPAVADVLSRSELKRRGIDTLSRALDMQPGFYMAPRASGARPYLRGIPDSMLLLYDTVPIGSDITKSLHPMDHDLSLASVKRIEIIRGPGSVLWGPDAFAGIVNVVPLTGADIDGIETGVQYGCPGEQRAFYTNLGTDTGLWDAAISVSGREGKADDTSFNVVKFWGEEDQPVPPEQRFGDDRPDPSRYLEASARASYRDWFTLSGRISDSRRNYTITDGRSDHSWEESRRVPLGFIKLESRLLMDRGSAIRFTGSYAALRPEYRIIDRTLHQSEMTSYAELIYDRSLFTGQGLLTAGISHREKHIKNAPIWDSYLPDYLGRENLSFLPSVTERDYETRLSSIFGQYSHKVGDVDLWAGMRVDDHDGYQDHLSFNGGFSWSFLPDWMVKALYGTAYRTPFAKQLREDEKPEPENIDSLNLYFAWKPDEGTLLGVCGFWSEIESHVLEDPYAGLSRPNRQEIYGAELEARFQPHEAIDLAANLTLIRNSGDDETYRYNDYSFIRPDGTVVEHFIDISYPYDTGPDSLFNLMGTWRPFQRWSLFSRLRYVDSTSLIYPRIDTFRSVPSVWLIDFNATVSDIGSAGWDLSMTIQNLTDTDYDIPGTYNVLDGDPATFQVELRKRW